MIYEEVINAWASKKLDELYVEHTDIRNVNIGLAVLGSSCSCCGDPDPSLDIVIYYHLLGERGGKYTKHQRIDEYGADIGKFLREILACVS